MTNFFAYIIKKKAVLQVYEAIYSDTLQLMCTKIIFICINVTTSFYRV